MDEYTVVEPIVLVPLNTSGRSKMQIVQAVENGWLKVHLVSTNTPLLHMRECRCLGCYAAFQRALDSLVATSETAVHESPNVS